MKHRAQILWVPADREHSVICVICGTVLQEGIDGLEIEWPGECEGLGDTLDIEASENIGTKDIFGGA